MFPPIFSTCNVAGVQALLKTGSGPLRLYAFGSAPQDVAKPYAVWRQVFGSPENYLGDTPDMDSFGVQIDVYALPSQGGTVARDVAKALRDAIEPHAYITAWRGESRDPETQNFVYSFDTEWLVDR